MSKSTETTASEHEIIEKGPYVGLNGFFDPFVLMDSMKFYILWHFTITITTSTGFAQELFIEVPMMNQGFQWAFICWIRAADNQTLVLWDCCQKMLEKTGTPFKHTASVGGTVE